MQSMVKVRAPFSSTTTVFYDTESWRWEISPIQFIVSFFTLFPFWTLLILDIKTDSGQW